MELDASGLVLRPPEEHDIVPFTEAVLESLPELCRFMPWAVDGYSEANAAQWVRGEIEADAHRFVIVDADGIVGACALNGISERDNQANLGYWIRTRGAGRGHATRAARALARYGFDQIGLARIKLYMSTRNPASRRVAEKIGATEEGLMRSRLLLHGERHDAHLFSLLPGEVRETPADPQAGAY